MTVQTDRFVVLRVGKGRNTSRVLDTLTGRKHFATADADGGELTVGRALPVGVRHDRRVVTFEDENLGVVRVNGKAVGAIACGVNGGWFAITIAQALLADPLEGMDNVTGMGHATSKAAALSFENCGLRRCVTCGNPAPGMVD